MAKGNNTGKRLQIDKANSTMLLTVAGAAFVVTFSLIAGKALLDTRAYQARVIKEKTKASNQLKANIDASAKLMTSYQAFVGTPDNIIGGNPKGTGDHDGDNAKIVLDALPSKYDYPALASSLEKVLASKNYVVSSITGTDDELAQDTQNQKPQPVEMPFDLIVKGNFGSDRDLMLLFEKSIRPINVKSLTLTSSNNTLDADVKAVTYYQPAKNLKIDTKEVK